MITPASPPPGTRAGLAGADTWASIAYDVDGPSLEFVRPPFNLDLPLTDAELVGMADGVFPAQVEAAIAAATMPPARPLTEADWATLAGIARAALRAASPDARQPEAPPGLPGRFEEFASPQEDAPPVTNGTLGDAAASPSDEENRDFKVILEFAARGVGSRQVVISVGGEGRSESFRRCDVDDWRDALLAEAPRAIEAFFARCLARPVHPPFRPAPALAAAYAAKHGTGAAKERPGRRGKGGASATSPLLVFTPTPGDPDPGTISPVAPELTPAPVTPGNDLGPAKHDAVPEVPTQGEDGANKPMQQQLSFLFG